MEEDNWIQKKEKMNGNIESKKWEVVFKKEVFGLLG